MFVCRVFDVAFSETFSVFVHTRACLHDPCTCVFDCLLTLVPKGLAAPWFLSVSASGLTDGLTDVQKEDTVLYHEIPSSLLEIYGRFEVICYLHLNRSRFLGNVGKFVPDYTPSHFRIVFFGHGRRNLRISRGPTFLTFHIDFAYALNVHNLFCFWHDSPQWARASSLIRCSRSQTTTHHNR